MTNAFTLTIVLRNTKKVRYIWNILRHEIWEEVQEEGTWLIGVQH